MRFQASCRPISRGYSRFQLSFMEILDADRLAMVLSPPLSYKFFDPEC